jgi:CheY-like chemotaxis protein
VNVKQNERLAPTILFIHAPNQSRLIVKTVLQFCGFEIIATTESGILKSIEEIPKIDFIVLDFVHDIRELKSCLLLKKEQKTQHTPLVAIIANPEITQEKLRSFYIDEIIRAPVDVDELEIFFKEYIKKISR